MNKPLLHPATKKMLEAYLLAPTHGLLLTGEANIGKEYIAQWLARKRNQRAYIIKKPEDKSTISIAQIRELYSLTRSRTELTIIIKDSHLMGTEAQNAFLKLLEEPPEGTSFILTAHKASSLLQTIRSRTQEVIIIKPSRQDLKTYILTNSSLEDVTADALLVTSGGKLGVLSKLLADPAALQAHLEAVTEAKKFYSLTAYQRHMTCITHNYEKDWIVSLLNLLEVIIHSLLQRASNSPSDIARLSAQAHLIEQTSYRTLKLNGNPKIHLAKLAQQL